MRAPILIVAAAATVASAAAGARTPRPAGNPAQIQRLLGCSAITTAAERLACFDRETSGLGQALAKRDLVVIEIQQSVTGIGRNAEGGWTVKLADGSSWSQTDDVPIALPPRRGDKVTIRRRTLGAFAMSVNGQPGVRVRRIG
jgi:hypothetical protein